VSDAPGSIDVIRSAAGLEALAPEWDRLADGLRRPLLRHDWFASCIGTLHDPCDLTIVVVRHGDRVTGIAPLVRAGRGAAARLELIGVSSLHEPSGFLYESAEARDRLLAAVLALGTPLSLHRLETASDTAAALRAAVGRRGLVVVRETRPSLAVAVRGPWADYERGLSSRITGNLPRLRKRAARIGPVRVDVHRPSVADVGSLFAMVVAVEGSGWKGERGSALRCRPGLGAFFEAYVHRAARRGDLRIATLLFGDRIAAVEMAIEAYDRWWQLKIGYESGLGEYYPGLLLTYAMVQHAFERGLAAYEFLGSAAEWEERWLPERRAFEMCVVYPATISGGCGLLADALAVGRERWQRVARRPVSQAGKAALGSRVPARAVSTTSAAGRDAGVVAGDA
jgi:CelD/BcsL family acetyltransferase involved in cellulose biosynthesis